jgi:hypothetical protein
LGVCTKNPAETDLVAERIKHEPTVPFERQFPLGNLLALDWSRANPWRVVPLDLARDVAEVVWSAYHDDSRKLHWYFPAELSAFETAKVLAPSLAR